METKRTIKRINTTRNLFYEKINKTAKVLTRRTRGNRDSIQINKIRNEKGDITTETEEIKKLLEYEIKLENHDEMDSFLDGY